MKCEPGFHTYRPFPRSRDLFCSSCGDQPGDDGWKQNGTHTAALVVPEQTQLEFEPDGPRDPEADMARRIIEEQRGKSAEKRAREGLEFEVRRILERAELPEEMAEELLRDALNFGTELDLDQFAGLVEAHARQAPADDVSTVI